MSDLLLLVDSVVKVNANRSVILRASDTIEKFVCSAPIFYVLCFERLSTKENLRSRNMAVKKKVAKKKVAKKKAAAAAPVKKIKATTTKQTKTQVIAAIAESTGLTKKDVAAVFSNLGDMITSHMKQRGSGEFQIPDTGVKIRRVMKPARKARMGRNPQTGEAIKIAARKASKGIKVTALKALKDTINA
jgi:nucleoid DNA-binding protein